MKATVGDVLRVLTGVINPALITPSAWQRLLDTGDRIPLSSGGGIECRPADPDCADLAVRFLSTEKVTDALLDPPLVVAGEAGPALAGLARRWRAETGPPPRRRMLWLELDLGAGSPPIPSVFAGPGNPPRGTPDGLPDDEEWRAIVNLLRPGCPACAVDRLLGVLPRGAWIGYIGIMRGRELRATVSGVTPDEVPSLLCRLAWPGETYALERVLGVVRAHSARITLGLDLTDGIGRALGLELAPFAPDCWERLLQGTASLVPISDTARAALLAWPGESVSDATWPAPLRAPAGRIVRRLNHVKFGIDGASRPRLKAYLYFGLLD
jgi:hypothetical protein